MKKVLFLFLFLVSVASTGGYTQSPSGVVTSKDMVTLDNTTWKVVSIKDRAVESDISATVHFGALQDGKGRISGNSGCNRFSGQYYLSHTEKGQTILGFSQFGTTRMACISKEKTEVEKAFLETIPFIQSFFLLNGKLSLQTVDGKIAVVLIPTEEEKSSS